MPRKHGPDEDELVDDEALLLDECAHAQLAIQHVSANVVGFGQVLQPQKVRLDARLVFYRGFAACKLKFKFFVYSKSIKINNHKQPNNNIILKLVLK